MNFCNEIQHEWSNIFFLSCIPISKLTFCLKYLASMCPLLKKMISLLITEVPKKLNIPAVE